VLEALPRTEIIKGDIGNPATVHQAVEGVDAVLHLAALLPLAASETGTRRSP